MFSMVGCNEATYNWLRERGTITGDFSQENVSIFGVTVAHMQPNMIGEIGEPDFFWCLRPLRWLLQRAR